MYETELDNQYDEFFSVKYAEKKIFKRFIRMMCFFNFFERVNFILSAPWLCVAGEVAIKNGEPVAIYQRR